MQDIHEPGRSPREGARAILSMSLSTRSFGSKWSHCGQVVDYLARYTSAPADDVDRSAMMFSAVFNEVLETIARHHASRGAIRIELRETGSSIELDARIPVDEGHLGFYVEASRLASWQGLKDWYREQMRHGALDCDVALLGLAELATTFRASIRVAPPTGGVVHLTVAFPLSEMEES